MKLKFPEHIVIIGKTGSGKSHLLGEILARNHELFYRQSCENIALVLSPHKQCELPAYMSPSALDQWTIHHIRVSVIGKEEIERAMGYLKSQKLLGKEIMLILDDLAFRAQFAGKSAEALVHNDATLRHQNISIVTTLQLHNAGFYDLMSNSGYVCIMNAMGQRKIIANIIRYYVQSSDIKGILDWIYKHLENEHRGDYIAVCLGPEANENKMYTLVNDMFRSPIGIYRHELENL